MSEFGQFTEKGLKVAPALPLAHTTDWHSFRGLKTHPTLKTQRCRVYDEDLLYFFYGKPCFRLQSDVDSTSLSAFHLVSLIIDGSTLPNPYRILPFDSGAFRRGLYSADIHPKMELRDFEIFPTLTAASQLVERFYGSNKAYFRAKLRSDLSFSCEELEVESYVSIVSSKKITPIDERRSAIEIQIAEMVSLLNCKIYAVIIPEQFLDHDPVFAFISKTLGAEPLGYFCPHARPAEDARAIMNEAFRFYQSKGWL